jgi:Na+/H+ antiporter NhaD/arsenite permease-like protein
MIMDSVPNIQWAAVALSLFSGVISAFVDNVATVLMVAPVALEICKKLKTNPIPFIISIAVSSNLQGAATLVGDTTSIMLEPYLLYFGLLSGATLGGSLTPVGASANITAVGLLRKEGYHVSFGQFMKIGIPYTLAAVMTGYLYFWYIWR